LNDTLEGEERSCLANLCQTSNLFYHLCCCYLADDKINCTQKHFAPDSRKLFESTANVRVNQVSRQIARVPKKKRAGEMGR